MSAPAGLSQAALMVLLFEEADAAAILGEMTPEDLRLLGREMAALGTVETAQVASAIRAFCECAEPSLLPRGSGPDAARSVIETALGPVKADGVLHTVVPRSPPSRQGPLAILPWLSPDAMLTLCADENPQVVAALLCQIDAEPAAQVLSRLAETVQSEVVHRIAKLRPIAPDAFALLEELVETRLSESFATLPLALGGIQEAADIVNRAVRSVEKRVMPAIGKRDRATARRMEQAMFRFDMLLDLDPKAIGQVLREVDSQVLVMALKGLEDDVREPFFQAMSGRAADGVRDEIEASARVRLADAEEAQREIVATARRLAAEGAIVFGGGDDDYV